jgi:hypothetical protein
MTSDEAVDVAVRVPAQASQAGLAGVRVPSAGTFAESDADHHAFGIDVARLYRDGFTDAQAGA